MIKKIVFLMFFLSFLMTQTFIEEVMSQKPLWTGSFGTVSINGETYNQISLRPEFNLGKWGLGFDFYLYIDGDGNIYEDSWNFSTVKKGYQTLIDKLKYIRYGYPGDQFYFKVGTLSGISLGHGILVEEYSNMMRYPEIRKVGFQLSTFLDSGIGIEFVQSDFKYSPSLLGARINYPLFANFDIGVSFATDVNQNAGLDDSDGDDVPDFIDVFPEIEGWMTDTDGDGLADQDPDEYDIDGDGWDTEGLTEQDIIDLEDALNTINELLSLEGDEQLVVDADNQLNPDEVVTFEELEESVTGIAADFTYHINENFKLYSEFAKLTNSKSNQAPNGQIFDPGWGMIPLGLKGHYGPFSFKCEYRKNSKHFVYNFWDRLYDINRSIVDGSQVKSKASQLYRYGSAQGIYLNASGSVYNVVTLGVGYQDLTGQIWNETAGVNGDGALVDANTRNFLSTISLNTTSIPKVKYFNGFYQKTNFNKFSFSNPDQNTVFGFDLGIDFSESMLLVYKSRTSYEPDGQGNFKKVNSMFVETQILF